MDPVAERWRALQPPVCARFGVERDAPALELNAGVSENIIRGRFFDEGVWPLHGLRHPATVTTSGWYLWAGEWSPAADFFKAVHTVHLDTWAADAVPYLGLPPGWRFLLAPGYEDVWFDESIL
jgi:hypothetical protein